MSRFTHPAGRGLLAACLLLTLWLSAAPASAAIFVFEQTTASVPGLVVSSTITINGDPGDLPILDSFSAAGPIDFGNLLAFNIVSPVGHFTLSDFVPACQDPGSCLLDFPSWSVSPAGISFIDVLDASDFIINGFGINSTIQVDTDAPVIPVDCGSTGACVVTGNWIAAAVPEPSSIMLLMGGLASVWLARRRRTARRAVRSPRLRVGRMAARWGVTPRAPY